MFVRDDSDWDVWLIVRVGAFADYEERYDSEHGDPVEIGTDTVAGLRAHGEPGTSHWWNRYAFRHAKVLVDKLDGEIGEIVDSKRTLPEDAAPAIAAAALDGYVNSTYRSLKAHRLGQVIGAHLDAADAASHLLDALFALRGRVRPWSKYLRWELESEPLAAGAAWRADVFLDRLESLLREPSPRPSSSSSATSRSSPAAQVTARCSTAGGRRSRCCAERRAERRKDRGSS